MPDSAILDVTGRVRPDGVTYAPRDASPLRETRRVCRVPPTIGRLAEQSPHVMVRERLYTPSRQFVWIALFLSSCCCRSTASGLPQVDLVFETSSQLRFRPVSDGVSSIFPLIRRPFRDTGRQHRSARIFVNSRNLGQLNLCLALSVQHLKPGHQIALREGRLTVNQASGDEIQCAATPVPGRWVEWFEKSIAA